MRKATRSAFPIVRLLLGARRFETGRSHIGRGCALPGGDGIGQGSGGGLRSLYGSFCRSFRSVRFDTICGVSEQVTAAFDTEFPELSHLTGTVENILPQNLIERQSNNPQGEMQKEKPFKLLSVGRFSEQKNFDNVPDICRRLVADGLDVTWYLIGYGGDEALIRQKIVEAGMQEHVIILGKRDNPYPYMRACDLYVQPSRYEGKAVTVREAQLLGKPVVITDYATSGSQLEDGVDGVIVPMDNEGCAAGIAALLRDPARMQQLSENCAKRDYTNSAEVEKIYALMED